jgi:hypothetical protein
VSVFRRAAERGKGWASTFHSNTMVQTGPRVPNQVLGAITADGVAPHVPETWGYHDAVGEYHSDIGFFSACLSRCTLRLGVIDQDNKIGPAFDEKGDPLPGVPVRLAKLGAKMIAGLRSAPGQDGPGGGHGMLLGRMGANLFAVGECYLIATKTAMGDHWEVVSTMEMQPADTPEGEKQRFRRRKHRGVSWQEFTPNFYLRIYLPHPAFSMESDSAALSLLSTLERIALLDAEGIADSKSRLKGPGIEWIPSEIDFPGTDEDPNADEYVSRKFIETASIAIRNPESASRHVPIVMRAPGDRIKQILHQRFDYNASKLIDDRAAAVGNLARAVPLPYESTTGYGETSFANAFAIEGQLARIFVSPPLDIITGILTAGWFTKGLMAATGATVPSDDILRCVVWYDVSELVTDPDPTKVAMWAYGTDTNPNDIIGPKGVRRLLGIPEGEAPTPEQTAARIERAQKLRARSEQGDNRPDTEPEDGKPEEEPTGERDKDEEVGKRVLALADTMVHMAVGAAGNKLRAKVANRPEMKARIDGVDADEVFRRLGPGNIEALGGTAPLLNGAFSAFERTVTAEFVDAGRHDAADLAAAATEMAKVATLARLANPAASIDTRVAAKFLDLLNNPPG